MKVSIYNEPRASGTGGAELVAALLARGGVGLLTCITT